MTKPATFTQAALERAVKVAEKRAGWKVVVQGDTITLLPIDPNAASLLPDDAEAEAAWDKALGLQ